jgi:hypothetical protein
LRLLQEKIVSNKDFIAVSQLYPKFPYSKFHSYCYSHFLKNKFWVIAPTGTGIINGKNGTRSVYLSSIFFVFWMFVLLSVYKKVPQTTTISIIFLIFFLFGLLSLIAIIGLRAYIYYKFEKNLK